MDAWQSLSRTSQLILLSTKSPERKPLQETISKALLLAFLRQEARNKKGRTTQSSSRCETALSFISLFPSVGGEKPSVLNTKGQGDAARCEPVKTPGKTLSVLQGFGQNSGCPQNGRSYHHPYHMRKAKPPGPGAPHPEYHQKNGLF